MAKSQEAFRQIYILTSTGRFTQNYAFRNQIRKAAISVSSNIAEGYGRHSKREFSRFLSIAKGSVFEERSQIRLAEEIDYIQKKKAKSLITSCRETSRLIGGLRKSIKSSP